MYDDALVCSKCEAIRIAPMLVNPTVSDRTVSLRLVQNLRGPIEFIGGQRIERVRRGGRGTERHQPPKIQASDSIFLFMVRTVQNLPLSSSPMVRGWLTTMRGRPKVSAASERLSPRLASLLDRFLPTSASSY